MVTQDRDGREGTAPSSSVVVMGHGPLQEVPCGGREWPVQKEQLQSSSEGAAVYRVFLSAPYPGVAGQYLH